MSELTEKAKGLLSTLNEGSKLNSELSDREFTNQLQTEMKRMIGTESKLVEMTPDLIDEIQSLQAELEKESLLKHAAYKAGFDEGKTKGQAENDALVVAKDDLLQATKMAYRKHVCNDDSIGWSELGDRLCDALCNEMGDDEFNKEFGES